LSVLFGAGVKKICELCRHY